MLKTACRNSSWFGFYDLYKIANFGPTEGFPCFPFPCFFSAKTLIPHNSKTIGRTSMKFGMQLPYGNTSGQFFAFQKKIDFHRFLPFFIEKHSFFLIPHNSKTIGRTSMKFGMQLPYGNTSGQFFAFQKKIDFRRFLPFFHRKTQFFLVPHNSKTIYRISMKIGMQLRYGNALGYFKAFPQIFHFRRFLPFFIEKHGFLQILITQKLFVVVHQ